MELSTACGALGTVTILFGMLVDRSVDIADIYIDEEHFEHLQIAYRTFVAGATLLPIMYYLLGRL